MKRLALVGAAVWLAQAATAAPLDFQTSYTLDGAWRDHDTPGAQAFELNGNLLTQLQTPWGGLRFAGRAQYQPSTHAYLTSRQDLSWEGKVGNSRWRYRVGDLAAGHEPSWTSATTFTGFQIQQSQGSKPRNRVDSLAPSADEMRLLGTTTWRWPTPPSPATAMRLLSQGNTEYTLQAGRVRVDTGTPQAQLDQQATVTATLRRGILPSLTAETYLAARRGVRQQGMGMVGRLGEYSSIQVGGTVSETATQHGHTYAVVYRAQAGRLSYFAGLQRRSAGHTDLEQATRQAMGNPLARAGQIDTVGVDWRPAGSLHTIRVNYVYQSDTPAHASTHMMQLAHRLRLGHQVTLLASAFTSLQHTDDFGVYLGVRLPLSSISSSTTTAAAPGLRPGNTQRQPLAAQPRTEQATTLSHQGSLRLGEQSGVTHRFQERYQRRSVW